MKNRKRFSKRKPYLLDALEPRVLLASQISVSDLSIFEGNSGTRRALFSVDLDQPATKPVTVNFSTTPGTAAVATDYLAHAGRIIFRPGQVHKTIPVRI